MFVGSSPSGHAKNLSGPKLDVPSGVIKHGLLENPLQMEMLNWKASMKKGLPIALFDYTVAGDFHDFKRPCCDRIFIPEVQTA